MIITQNAENIQISLPKELDKKVIQNIIEYIHYSELVANSQAKQADADMLAHEVNKNWWTKNKNRFVK